MIKLTYKPSFCLNVRDLKYIYFSLAQINYAINKKTS